MKKTKNYETFDELVGFVPTRVELFELARYWAEVAVERQWHFFVNSAVGGCDVRMCAYAEGRIDTIRELLGKDVVNKLVDEVYEEFGNELSQDTRERYWEVFRHGNAEQRNAVSEEIMREEELAEMMLATNKVQ